MRKNYSATSFLNNTEHSIKNRTMNTLLLIFFSLLSSLPIFDLPNHSTFDELYVHQIGSNPGISPYTNDNKSLELFESDVKYFEIDGLKRKYILHLPNQLKTNAPLVFVLHGYGGSAERMIEYSKMNQVADKHGFAVCYPEGNFGPDNKNSWNAGYSNSHVDDVKFISALALSLQNKYNLSTKNTFCTGMSNGGDMSYVLACNRPGLFAAFASVAGCMMQTTYNSCHPEQMVPILEIHGTDDHITLWDGDPEYSKEYGGYLATRDVIDFWVKNNGCTQMNRDTFIDLDQTDGSYVVREKHLGGSQISPVWLYTLIEGKHDWPGSFGNKDIQTSEEIWEFFKQFIQEENLQPVSNDPHFTQSTPEAQGISSSTILEFINRVETEVDAVHSFMILRHGKLISQGWWSPYDSETPHVMHSLSKSFTSSAIGLAIGEGRLTLDDLVVSFFPVLIPENASQKLKSMRIRDLLTMNTGHITEPKLWSQSHNWAKAFLAAEVELTPGTHFKYNSAATYMLSAIIHKITGQRLVDYLDSRLFQPLQIQKPEWDMSPDGINTGGWGLNIITEDIAKLGQLYLQKGMWNGKRILSEEWVEMATDKQVSNGSNPDNDWHQGYGFQFWQCRHNAYRGDGAFGQFCIVLPEHDAVIAITSGTSNMGAVMKVVWETLLPGMNATSLPPNADKLEELKKKTQNLKLKPISGSNQSTLSEDIYNRTFTLENGQKIKSVTFDLTNQNNSIRMEMVHGTETIEVGYNNYYKSKLNETIPFAPTTKKLIASSGAWITDDEYQVRIYFHESPARITYDFKFHENELIWECKPEQALFGSRNAETLVGK